MDRREKITVDWTFLRLADELAEVTERIPETPGEA